MDHKEAIKALEDYCLDRINGVEYNLKIRRENVKKDELSSSVRALVEFAMVLENLEGQRKALEDVLGFIKRRKNFS